MQQFAALTVGLKTLKEMPFAVPVKVNVFQVLIKLNSRRKELTKIMFLIIIIIKTFSLKMQTKYLGLIDTYKAFSD